MYNFVYIVSILRGISKNSSGDRILLRSMLESVNPAENQRRHVPSIEDEVGHNL
jgi:hypothetical protein